jgi:hypothetical protein
VGGLEPLGRTLLILGLVTVAVGVLLIVAPRVPFLGRLPGDIRIEREGVTILIPLATMALLSIVVSIVLSLLGRR